MWSIIITSAGILYFVGLNDIETAHQPGSSLGYWLRISLIQGICPKLIFALGINETSIAIFTVSVWIA
jgi:hypothetical protein